MFCMPVIPPYLHVFGVAVMNREVSFAAWSPGAAVPSLYNVFYFDAIGVGMHEV